MYQLKSWYDFHPLYFNLLVCVKFFFFRHGAFFLYIKFSEKLLLQCSSLEKVHASGCQDLLTAAIQSQVWNYQKKVYHFVIALVNCQNFSLRTIYFTFYADTK